MSTTTVSLSFETDAEDFISRSCPECEVRFKAKVTDGETEISFCPFCKHEGNRWETPEQLEYGKAFAAKQVVQPHFDKLDRALKGLGRAGGGGLSVKVTGKMPDLKVPPKPTERVEELPQRTTFACCDVTLRHDDAMPPSFCIACGKAV